MGDTVTDITNLIRRDRARPDSAAAAHVAVSVGFLAVGAVLAGVALVSLSFPALVPLGYGAWRAMAMLCLLIGFATIGSVGAAYFVLPRLTGAPLWNERLAGAGLALTAAPAGLGVLAVGFGLGDGSEPFGLPLWLDLPLVVGLTIPFLVVVQTVRRRQEPRSYVSVPFLATGLGALPLVYLVGAIPGLNSMALAVRDAFSGAAYLAVAALVLPIGLLYYIVVKHTAEPLWGRQLATVSYWSLLFGLGWFGVAQLAGTGLADWLPAVTAVLGLALPVGVIAAAFHLAATVEGRWRRTPEPDPVVMASMAGLAMASVLAVLAASGGFRSAAVLLAFTPFWEGIVYGLVLGVAPLLLGAAYFYLLPRMTGRRLFSDHHARRFVKATVAGAGATASLLIIAGLVGGYSWAGGAFSGAYVPAGEEWSIASGAVGIFTGLAAAAGLVAAVGGLALASLIFRTVTRGSATAQEFLVTVSEGRDE